jgi:gas vesicle protein
MYWVNLNQAEGFGKMSLLEDDSNLDNVVIALAVGVGIGFGLGILFAPHAGAKTRKAIARSARDGFTQFNDTVDDLRSSASDFVEKGKRAVGDHKETIAQALDSAKKVYRNATS